jgi:hypothetical protein
MADLDSDFECEIDAIVERQRAAQVARYEKRAAKSGVIGKLPVETTPDLWQFVSRLNTVGLLSVELSLLYEEYGGDEQLFLSKLDPPLFVELLRLVRLHGSIWTD